MRGVASTYHRVFTFTFRSPEEALRFVELLSEHLRGANIIVNMRGSSVKVRVYGSRDEIEDVALRMRDALTVVRGSGRAGLKRYPLRYLLDKAELRASIPIDLLRDVLELKGFKASIERGCLATDASLSDVLAALEGLSEAYLSLVRVKASPKAKRLAALLSSVRGVPAPEALEELARSGVIRRVEGAGTYVSAMEYGEALSAVRKLLSEGADR